MGLVAFDVYMGCREQIYEIKVKEMQSNAFTLLKRAKILVEKPGPGPDGS
jgi:hypothetical protein